MIEYALSALIGAFLFAIGYWFGKKEIGQKPLEQKAMIADDSDHITEKYCDINQQLLNMMNYTGRTRNED